MEDARLEDILSVPVEMDVFLLLVGHRFYVSFFLLFIAAGYFYLLD